MKPRRSFWAAVSILVVMALLVAGCPARQPEARVGKHIIAALSTDIVTLDPHRGNDGPSMTVWNQVYCTLFDLNAETRELIPKLAERWERVDDRTTRLFIRRGVKFHDGTPLTARDVEFSLKRLVDPATKSPAAFILTMLEDVRTVDDHTVEITTKEPFAPLLFHLTHRATSIVPEAVVKAKGEDFARQPVGTGPFKFVEHVKGDRVELERNPDYWGGAPVPERVTLRIIPEPATQAAEVEAGSLHIASAIPLVDVPRLRDLADVEVLTMVGWGITGLLFNHRAEPFDDVRVRRAVSYALDRDAIVTHVEHGLAIPAAQVSSPVVFGHNPNLQPYPHDPAKARQLLAEAGYPQGFETTILVWNIERFIRWAEAVQAQLAQVGIDAELNVVEFGAALEMAYRGEFEIVNMGWGCPTLDSDYNLFALFHSASWGPPGNWGFYQNPEVDRLIMVGRTSADMQERERAYHRVMELLHQDAAWAFSHHPTVVLAKRAELRDSEISVSFVYMNLRRAYIQE